VLTFNLKDIKDPSNTGTSQQQAY